MFERIEKALGFKLFVWQKTIITQGRMRRTGETTALALKELVLPRNCPIDHTFPAINQRHKIERQIQIEIKQQLYEAGILTNPIAHTHEEFIQMLRSWDNIARPVEDKTTFESDVSPKWY